MDNPRSLLRPHSWSSTGTSMPIQRYRAPPGVPLAGSSAQGLWRPLTFSQPPQYISPDDGDKLVCTGSPAAALSLSRLKSFLAIKELGYVCCKAPLLLTTSSAEYGRLIPSYLGPFHHSCTSLTCCSNMLSSADPDFSEVGRS